MAKRRKLKRQITDHMATQFKTRCPSCGRLHRISRPLMSQIVDAYWLELGATLRKLRRVVMRGLGTLSLTTRKGRTWVNPVTKKTVVTPERSHVKFVASRAYIEFIESEQDPYVRKHSLGEEAPEVGKPTDAVPEPSNAAPAMPENVPDIVRRMAEGLEQEGDADEA